MQETMTCCSNNYGRTNSSSTTPTTTATTCASINGSINCASFNNTNTTTNSTTSNSSTSPSRSIMTGGFTIGGTWYEKGSGRVWQSSQCGNTFMWIQEGTGRIATGTLVSTSDKPAIQGWIIHMSMDVHEGMHARLSPSPNGKVLSSLDGTVFLKMTGNECVQKPNVQNVGCGYNMDHEYSSSLSIGGGVGIGWENPIGSIYKDKSGTQIWVVVSCPYPGIMTFRNQQDGRVANCYMTQAANGRFISYFQFSDCSHPIRCESSDLSKLALSNGLVLNRMIVHHTKKFQPSHVVESNTFSTSISIPCPQISYHDPNTTTSFLPSTIHNIDSNVLLKNNRSSSLGYSASQNQRSSTTTGSTPTTTNKANVIFVSNIIASSIIRSCSSDVNSKFSSANTNSLQEMSNERVKMALGIIAQYRAPLNSCEISRILNVFSFEHERMEVMRKIVMTGNVQVMDSQCVVSILSNFTTESFKKEIVVIIRPQITDRRLNSELIAQCFQVLFTRNCVREFLIAQ